jgi:hypothetical protein
MAGFTVPPAITSVNAPSGPAAAADGRPFRQMDVKWMEFTGDHSTLYSQAGDVQRLMIGDERHRRRYTYATERNIQGSRRDQRR